MSCVLHIWPGGVGATSHGIEMVLPLVFAITSMLAVGAIINSHLWSSTSSHITMYSRRTPCGKFDGIWTEIVSQPVCHGSDRPYTFSYVFPNWVYLKHIKVIHPLIFQNQASFWSYHNWLYGFLVLSSMSHNYTDKKVKNLIEYHSLAPEPSSESQGPRRSESILLRWCGF